MEVELSSLSLQPVKIDAAIAREAATQSHFLKFIQSLSFSVTTAAPTTTTTEAELMQGNVDGDDVISVSDAVATLKIYAMSAAGMDVSSFTAAQFRAADIDGDGIVSVSDAVYLLTYYAKKAAGIDVTWDDIVNK